MSVKKQGGSEADRAARLAEQLRANLRKRKVQARGADTFEGNLQSNEEEGQGSEQPQDP